MHNRNFVFSRLTSSRHLGQIDFYLLHCSRLTIIVVISRKRRSFRHAKKVRKCGSHGPGGGRRPCIARYRWRIAQYDFRIGLEIREADAKHSACTTRRRKESAAKRRAGDATKKVRNWSRFLSRWTHSDISGDRHSALAASRATTSRLAMSAAERAPDSATCDIIPHRSPWKITIAKKIEKPDSLCELHQAFACGDCWTIR